MRLSAKVVGKTFPLVDGISNVYEFIEYQAKVSNPSNQLKKTHLIQYLKDQKHWSPFDMANFQIEVECPRDIARQILRHSSMRFQEFSQRYADVNEFSLRELRRQDTKNRQNSIDDFSEKDKLDFEEDCRSLIQHAEEIYNYWRSQGAAKECCRVFLPEGLTMSRLYANGTVRTWMHYLSVREEQGVTQKEHVMVANAIREVLHKEEPELF